MYLAIDEKPFDKIAVVQDSGENFSYGEIVEFTREWKQWIPHRELIFILCSNNMATIAGHIACIENRIVPLMISAKMDILLLESLTETYKPKYIWCEKGTELLKIICGIKIQEKYGYILYQTKYGHTDMYNDLSMLLTTSGSTGSPKLVRHSYKNLISNAKNVADFFQFNGQDRSLIDLQLHYTMGLNVACSSLYAGATLMMTKYHAMQKEYWDFFDRSDITNITGVPYNYEILKRLKFFKKDYPYLRILAEGGGKLTDVMFKEIAEYAHDHNKRFYATFGTSETTARLAYLSPEMALRKIGSIGKAIPNGRLFLIDKNGKEIKQIEAEGELAYQGENVTLGYATNREELTKGDERKGVYFTGDLARRDCDGFYYICGRKSRFLKLYSYRVGLDECERLIETKFGIECACVGTDNKMIIYVTDDERKDDIREYVANTTKIVKVAYEVRKIDQIPKNEVGKIMYSKLDKN